MSAAGQGLPDPAVPAYDGRARPLPRGIRRTDHYITVFPSAEDGGYIGEIPDLPGCSAFGTTPERAAAEVVIAKQAWVEVAAAAGLTVPAPHPRPGSAGSAI